MTKMELEAAKAALIKKGYDKEEALLSAVIKGDLDEIKLALESGAWPLIAIDAKEGGETILNIPNSEDIKAMLFKTCYLRETWSHTKNKIFFYHRIFPKVKLTELDKAISERGLGEIRESWDCFDRDDSFSPLEGHVLLALENIKASLLGGEAERVGYVIEAISALLHGS